MTDRTHTDVSIRSSSKTIAQVRAWWWCEHIMVNSTGIGKILKIKPVHLVDLINPNMGQITVNFWDSSCVMNQFDIISIIVISI